MSGRTAGTGARAATGIAVCWPAIARDGLIATGGTTMVLGVIALLAAIIAADADLARLFAAGAVALFAVGCCLVVRVGDRFATAVLTGLTGGAFALVLADMTSTAIDVPGRYAALRWVALLAANLIALLAFQDGFRTRVARSSSKHAPKAVRVQRRDRRGRWS